MDDHYVRCVQKVFVELYKKGFIYRGKRMVNWDPAARTALSDEEVEMIEQKGHLWHIKYPLVKTEKEEEAEAEKDFLVVATTRPETMLGDEAVAVNPTDERYKHLIGRKLLLPLKNKLRSAFAKVAGSAYITKVYVPGEERSTVMGPAVVSSGPLMNDPAAPLFTVIKMSQTKSPA